MNAWQIPARLHELNQAQSIADPGDAGTINVNKSLSRVDLVSAAAETRTLGDPTAAGDLVLLNFVTDGGDITVTTSTAYDQAGRTTFVLADAGDYVLFQSVKTSTTAFAWRPVSSDLAASNKGIIQLPMYAWQEADGTALADFSDGASSTPGYADAAEISGIRWNNHANPDPISTSFAIPPDFDSNVDCTVHFLAAKVGATVGDAVTWTTTVFNNADGALYDADADYGGASSAMTGDATSKTVQEETLTLATANLPSSPAAVTITTQPTDGTLGTDDVVLIACWIEYTRK